MSTVYLRTAHESQSQSVIELSNNEAYSEPIDSEIFGHAVDNMHKIRIDEILIVNAQYGVERVLFGGVYQVTKRRQSVYFIRNIVQVVFGCKYKERL